MLQSKEMSGYVIEGPYNVDGDDRLPRTSGVYIVLTRTKEPRLRGVYVAAAGNLKEHINNNPNKECWKKNEIDGLSIWIHSTIGKTEKEREKVLFDLRENRQYKMPCRD